MSLLTASRLLSLALLFLSLSSLVLGSGLQFRLSSAREQRYLLALHAPRALAHARALESVFLEMDANEDGQIDAYEMRALAHEGRISAAEHTLLRAFDSDASGAVSQAELTLAPLTLNMLETGVDLEAEAEAEVEADAPFHQSREEFAASAAFEGLDAPGFAPRRMKRRLAPLAAASEEDQVLSEVASRSASQSAASIPAAGTPRVKSTGSKRGTAPLPVSLYGVPSVADEECVLCQYFVQRIQNGVADRLENGPKAPAADAAAGGEGLPGATAAAQQALKVRNTNSQLSKKPGGRGIVRVVAEDLLQALCAVDKMPLLFNPYCSGIAEPNAINAVRKGIFFNMPTAEVCSQAALCRDDAYLNTNAAVHATKTSLFLNGQRGICGMLGGARDRPESREGLVLNAVCAAHGVVFGNGGL